MARTIMVVDDSRFIFEEMKHRLGDCGAYEIRFYCPNGEALLEAYERDRPDLVTIDIVMPGMDGIETTRRLLAEHPEARVIVVTSLVFDDTMDEARHAGALGFLAKPFEREKIIASFDAAFQARP